MDPVMLAAFADELEKIGMDKEAFLGKALGSGLMKARTGISKVLAGASKKIAPKATGAATQAAKAAPQKSWMLGREQLANMSNKEFAQYLKARGAHVPTGLQHHVGTVAGRPSAISKAVAKPAGPAPGSALFGKGTYVGPAPTMAPMPRPKPAFAMA